jgi:pantoate--beta-alanine ligase
VSAGPLIIGIVGAGRVGAVLGAALSSAGHSVVAVAAASPESRERAARLLPHVPVRPAEDVARAATDLLLLAVPDDALAGVVSGLQAADALRTPRIVAHTSGAHGLAVLGDVDGMALHPAMTFTGTAADLDRLPGVAWGVTAKDRAFAARIIADLGGVPEWVADEDRPLYHAALAHGANHLVTLVNDAGDMLGAAGVDRPQRVLAPLLHAALDNALRLGDAALTGPVSRGDAGTVAKHLERIPAEAVPAYLALARRTADRAVASGRLGPHDAALLLDALPVPRDLRVVVGTNRAEGHVKATTTPRSRGDKGSGVARTRDELRIERDALAGTVGVVMTMGALHEGHRALMRAAREQAESVLVTIFVNPLQFGPNEDFDRYPRTFERDLEICRAEGVDLVFAPGRDEMYPGGEPVVRVEPGPLGEILEGASRPGHFAGVLTVVCKLFLLTRADLAFFGEKDYQQLALIRQMVRDLEIPVAVRGVPTVREPDGLALSSRNRYLTPEQRHAALALSRALREGAAQADPDSVRAVASKILSESTGIAVDYLALTDPALGPAPSAGPARLLVAARVGTTRLIDNTAVHLGPAPR